MTIDQIEKSLVEPGMGVAGAMPDTAILRLWDKYQFIEYPRKELKQVIEELRGRIALISMGVESPTATDRLLLTVLKSFAGDVNT